MRHVYKGYLLINHGYYPPDRRVVWLAENIATGEEEFRAYTMRGLKWLIDIQEDLDYINQTAESLFEGKL